VIFMVSVQFVSHSIESWFDVKIEAALDSGLNLGHAALDSSLSDPGQGRRTTAPPTLAGQDPKRRQIHHRWRAREPVTACRARCCCRPTAR
jgi:nitrogen fixation/metabolism regulation signal transduction histidine kinase